MGDNSIVDQDAGSWYADFHARVCGAPAELGYEVNRQYFEALTVISLLSIQSCELKLDNVSVPDIYYMARFHLSSTLKFYDLQQGYSVVHILFYGPRDLGSTFA